MSKENNNQKKQQDSNNTGAETFLDRMKNDKMFARYVYGGLVIILALIVVIICIAVSKGSDADNVEPAEEVSGEESGTTAVSDNGVSLLENGTEPGFVDDGSLQENAYEAVNQIVNTYFAALASGDRNVVTQLKSDTNEEELIKIEKKSAYINAFENITVYTKLGNVENSYVAFVYYDINFKDLNTLAPGLTTLYICPAEDGTLHIYDGDLDEQTSERIKAVAAEADVADLFNRVEVAYTEAIESDGSLKTFMDELPTKLDTEVAAALAEQKAAQDAQAAAEEPAPEEAPAPVTEKVVATDTVNVRSSDSENADKLGKLDVGTQVVRYEAKENGWSRVDYNGQEGYVKSEYLSVVSEETETTDAAQADQTPEASGEAQGTVTVKETANVRKSAGEGADKIGVAYQGEHYKLLMKQADGWSKIQFGDKVGFVKSDFLEFN